MSGTIDEVKLPAGYYKAFVELHIEQGPLLERERIPLGVVERIAAPASLRLTFEGAGGHAGGVLMPDRKDALCAAAEVILALEHAAKSSGAIDTVATVGICDVFPGAVNSIPARVRLSVDIRDTNLDRRDRMMKTLEEVCRSIEARRGVVIHSELLNADAPADSGTGVISALIQACRKHGFPFLPMTSRAYHDSLFISRIAPVAMLFIPCRNGYSHRPDEYASPDDIARGTLVLAEALATLAE
jgi:ureidoglycolate amidohydrolase